MSRQVLHVQCTVQNDCYRWVNATEFASSVRTHHGTDGNSPPKNGSCAQLPIATAENSSQTSEERQAISAEDQPNWTKAKRWTIENCESSMKCWSGTNNADNSKLIRNKFKISIKRFQFKSIQLQARRQTGWDSSGRSIIASERSILCRRTAQPPVHVSGSQWWPSIGTLGRSRVETRRNFILTSKHWLWQWWNRDGVGFRVDMEQRERDSEFDKIVFEKEIEFLNKN